MHLEAEQKTRFSRRALVVGAGQVALLGALGARLWQLQVHDSGSYLLLAEDNRVNQRLLVPARGRILDRRGVPLAINVPTYRARIVREQAGDVRRALERLAQVVTLEPSRIEEVAAIAGRQRAFVPVTIREDLDWEEVARLALHSPDLPGVLLDAGLQRRYPHGEILSHVLGYVGAVSAEEQAGDPDPLLKLPDARVGKSGVERAYDRGLRGRAGYSRHEVNAIGREVRELERSEGEGGADLGLGLDLGLQRFCCERLATELAAAAVVVDVHTGAVLALASVPSFDPATFAGGLSPEVWRGLRDSPRHPLVNKCIRGQYPPGSTFKMVTALAALEAGVITPDTVIRCTGSLWLRRAEFHCWREHGHGRLALVQALGQSCDVFFYETARRVGIDAIAAMANRLGLGAPVGIDMPGEVGGLVPTRAWKKAATGESWQGGETLVCGIGQGFVTATPLQLAVMTARLASADRAVTPWLVRDANRQEAASAGLDPAHVAVVRQGMREVVHGARGTARAAAVDLPGVEVAGKTGTAQVRRISKADRASGRHKRKNIPWVERDHALFVGYAPAAAPRYAVSVVVEHGVSGARTAAPVARDILRKALELDPGAVAPPPVSVAEAAEPS